MKRLEELELVDTLPEAISQDISMRGFAYALQRQLHKLAKQVDSGAWYKNIDKATSAQLDHLAVEHDLQVWRDKWPVELKRRVLKTAFLAKSKVGTVSAVRDALSTIGAAAEIVEWWQTEPKGTPHTFNIIATLSQIEGTLTTEMQEDLQLMIKDSKPVRSHFTFSLIIAQEGGIGILGYARPFVMSRVSDLS